MFEVETGFGVAAEFAEEVGADAWQKVVASKRGFGSEGFYQVEGGLRAVDHGDGYSSVEFDDGGWSQVG